MPVKSGAGVQVKLLEVPVVSQPTTSLQVEVQLSDGEAVMQAVLQELYVAVSHSEDDELLESSGSPLGLLGSSLGAGTS